MLKKFSILYHIYLRSLLNPFGFRFAIGDIIKLFKIRRFSEDKISEKIDFKQREKAIHDAANWLLYAQHRHNDDGFATYKFYSGWTSSYPETSGYIIPSLYQYAILFDKKDILLNLIQTGDWLVSIQKESGGWQGGYVDENQTEVVFNTGQVLRGLICLYKFTNNEKYLHSACKAADWLCQIQHPDGYWNKSTYKNITRVFDSYVDAPLIELADIAKKEMYLITAIKNLKWIVQSKQIENGWFQDCENAESKNDEPILHTIAYTIDGLLSCGKLLQDETYIDAAITAASSLLRCFFEDGFLYARYNCCWKPTVKYMLLSGIAQAAIIWFNVYKINQNDTFLHAAIKLNNQLAFIQRRLFVEAKTTKGALTGSFPIWAKYEPFTLPNWATKYYLDSLMLEHTIMLEDKALTEKNN